MNCPCCGQQTTDISVTGLADVQLSFARKSVLRRLIEAYPRSVSSDALLDAVYSGARIPEHPREVLAVQLTMIRRIIEQYGWTIPRSGGGQGNHAYYKLCRTDEQERAA